MLLILELLKKAEIKIEAIRPIGIFFGVLIALLVIGLLVLHFFFPSLLQTAQ